MMSAPYLAVSSRARRAYDAVARGYDRVIGLAHPGYSRAVPAAWESLAARARPGWILELGPGTGLATAGLRAGADGGVIGIDLSRGMLRIARRRVAADWLLGDVCRGLPIRSASVELVAGQYVYGHFEDADRALAECFRVLRPGGWLVLAGREGGGLGLGHLGRRLNGTRGLDRVATSALLASAGFREIAWDELDPAAERMRSRFVRVHARRPAPSSPKARRTSIAGR